MQSDSLWITSICCCETMFSLSVVRSSRGSRYGWTARIFCQNGSMSTTRSLTIGRFPIAEIDRDATVRDEVEDPRLAGQHRAAVDAHPAGAADHHAAALAVGERPVDLVLDDVERVEERRLLGDVDLVRLERALARRGVVAPDLELDLHAAASILGSRRRVAPSGAPQPTTHCQFYRAALPECATKLCQIRADSVAISRSSPSAPTSSCAPRRRRAAARRRPSA